MAADRSANLDAARRNARRTALLFGGIALAVYAGFLLSGVLRA